MRLSPGLQTVSRWVPLAAWLVLSAACTLGILGCGNSGSPGDSTAESGTENEQASAEGTRKGDGPYVDDKGRKWLNPKIPYDVWYQDPLSVVAMERNVAPPDGQIPSTPAGTPGTTAPAPSGGKPASAAAAAAGTDWKDLVPASVIESEATRINNRFKEKLATVGSYNGSYLELPPHIALLAALGEVAVESSEDVKWKANAKFVRDLAASMLVEKLMAGPKSHKQVQLPAEQIAEILSGGTPATLLDAADKVEFQTVAEMAYLMKRLEIADKWLQVNTGTEASLKERSEDIIHEAHLVAMLARIITTEGYGLHDDEDFVGLAAPMREASLAMVESVKSGDFKSYELARSKVSQSCDACHGKYR